MQNQLFTWENWDDWEDLGDGEICYYEVTSIMSIGEFRVGTIFEKAEINYEKGWVKLWVEGKKHQFELEISVKKVSESLNFCVEVK